MFPTIDSDRRVSAEHEKESSNAHKAAALKTPSLFSILSAIQKPDLTIRLQGLGITDVWLPLNRLTLRHCFGDSSTEKAFLKAQDSMLEALKRKMDDGERLNLGFHLTVEDADEIMMVDEPPLGEGGYAIVEKVAIPMEPGHVFCVRKKIGRVKPFNSQKRAMDSFMREVSVMRQVDHRHCVDFWGSCTDFDSVSIFLQPVADMDLAVFLDLPTLGDPERRVLREGLGCLSDAVSYLHRNNIRHEDLKPQNVLIHSGKLVLTDFGFSLDFNDDGVSTTQGRPAHWTARYSAPEVIDHDKRNRATDIWGLGCILLEMLSCLYGHRLSNLKSFWKSTGNGHISFALNEEATSKWFEKLHGEYGLEPLVWMMLPHMRLMLGHDRHRRPSAKEVWDKVADLGLITTEDDAVIGSCCGGMVGDLSDDDRRSILHLDFSIYPAEIKSEHRSVSFERHMDFRYVDCNYILTGLDFQIFHSELCHGRVHDDDPITKYIKDPRGLQTVLKQLLADTKRCPPTTSPSPGLSGPEDSLSANSKQEALASIRVASLRNTYSTHHKAYIMLPGESEAWQLPGCDINISLVPFCFRRSPRFGNWFLVFGFICPEPHGISPAAK
ncbi:kinase-like domain-containing protein [Clohesyomyces aquaticus]|uniref:Kinase-like domain-containing protein n=1 Tax=Clohesyomyces aquaticus TaxID=1231657 RepID=A0A1Y2A3T2_9PLEO|nr:kinase-like domain-containing protein [Clohesyomyces aquaticus]